MYLQSKNYSTIQICVESIQKQRISFLFSQYKILVNPKFAFLLFKIMLQLMTYNELLCFEFIKLFPKINLTII